MSQVNYSVCLEPRISLEPKPYYFKPYSIHKQHKTSQQLHFTVTSPVQIHHNISNSFYNHTNTFPTKRMEDQLVHESISRCTQPSPNTKKYNYGEWTADEHERFLVGYKKYEKNWVMISKEFCTTRTRQQVRNHAVKFFMKLEKEKKKLKE